MVDVTIPGPMCYVVLQIHVMNAKTVLQGLYIVWIVC